MQNLKLLDPFGLIFHRWDFPIPVQSLTPLPQVTHIPHFKPTMGPGTGPGSGGGKRRIPPAPAGILLT